MKSITNSNKKEAFLIHGARTIYGNVPLEIMGNYFKDLSVIQAIISIGGDTVPLGLPRTLFG